ncbi:MAG: hypothetical protein ABSG78_22385 [Verrucomicrobiota bacterium]|jgi:hypothetical protein
MQKREIGWIVVLLLVIAAYIHFFSHWGEKREIQIFASIRQLPRRAGNASTFPVWFTLDSTYRLTSIKVTEVAGKNTNAVAHLLWHLVSKNVSEPVKFFQYGQNIDGMEPDLKGVRPEPLVPGEKYVLEISAGPLKGVSKPFTAPAIPK